jgi:glycosyltransferase involved in cell wall biosynthesis
MRIAIFHDYFGAIGGGERVVVEIAKILGADIITTDTDSVHKIDPAIQEISLGRTIKFPALKQISATLMFWFCDFSEDYDLFIFTGNWSRAAAHSHHPNIWYCYTPVRVFYDQYARFLNQLNPISQQLFRFWVFLNKKIDLKFVQEIDRILAISENVKMRILRYHNRNAMVIHPPLDTSQYRFSGSGDFWLSVNRLYPEKRIELQIETFRKIPGARLIIVGGYASGDHSSTYAKQLLKNKPQNVTFTGEISESDLHDLYAQCRAHICTAIDEDYGLTPLEAMASGKPVVAVNEGGYRETITRETGILVDADVDSIVRGVLLIDKDPLRFKEACQKRAKEFDISVFPERIFLKELW